MGFQLGRFTDVKGSRFHGFELFQINTGFFFCNDIPHKDIRIDGNIDPCVARRIQRTQRIIFFFFILLVFLMGFSILRTFKNIFFGSGNSTRKGEQRRQTNSNTSGHRSTTTTARDDDDDRTPYVHRKKIFAKDEGEYVDYEEVK